MSAVQTLEAHSIQASGRWMGANRWLEKEKGRRSDPDLKISWAYSVDSISKPQASRRGSGMYFEFLFFRAHSRSRVERMY